MTDPLERQQEGLHGTFPHRDETEYLNTRAASLDPELEFSYTAPSIPIQSQKEHYSVVFQAQLVDAVDILRRQKEQALADLELLHQAKREALADPEAFVLRLRANSLPKFPVRQVVCALPNTDWQRPAETPPQHRKRRSEQASSTASTPNRKPSSRLRESDKTPLRSPLSRSGSSSFAPPSGNDTCKPAMAASTDKLPVGIASPPTEEDRTVFIVNGGVSYGRLAHEEDKSLASSLGDWSAAEQQRLEQLLVQYPDETVSNRRWAKIARALGNQRTPKQVATRVQQLFVRLSLHNRPLPGGGKPPNMELYLNKRRRARTSEGAPGRRRNLPSLQAPAVYMSEGDALGDEPDLADLDEELKNSEEYKELTRLRMLQAERKNEAALKVLHFDFRCDSCGMDPIEGPRFRCLDCPAGDELDLCEQCVSVNFESGNHMKHHRFERINDARESDLLFRDEDYDWWGSSDQPQYLDPTFLIS